jgi:hypothetical protein
MHVTLAADDGFVGYVILAIIAFIALWIAYAFIREALFPRKFGTILRRFFGGIKGVSAHDKPFPSYDLASLNRAIDDFLGRNCTTSKLIGGMQGQSLSEALEGFMENRRVGEISYKRVPVDVEEEESVRSSCLWTATLRPELGLSGDNRIAIAIVLLGMERPVRSFSMGTQEEAVSSVIQISVACRSKEVAAKVFKEIEELRRKLNVFRGKVVVPEIDAGGIHSLGFSKLRLVAENELILPESTKRLIDGSVVAFYRNREKLREAGVEMKRGILLCSPPGTGKTSVALYLAGVLTDFTICFVAGRQLLYPREICQMARYLRPTMLVFEDIDLIAQDRDQNGLATILGELMNQIDGCHADEEVLFLMNTNSLERLERAVRERPGRVDQIIQLPLPDESARKRLVRLFGANLEIPADGMEKFASASDGITPATVKEVVKRAAVLAVQRQNDDENSTKVKVTTDDLMLAFEQVMWSRTA